MEIQVKSTKEASSFQKKKKINQDFQNHASISKLGAFGQASFKYVQIPSGLIDKFKLFTTRLPQVNSKLVSSKVSTRLETIQR